MGFLDQLFGMKRTGHEATAADQARSQRLTDRARSQRLEGQEVGQTVTERTATRGRMEADLAGQRRQREGASLPENLPCLHTTLTPRWDSVADMSNAEKVSGYTCRSCSQTFTAAEGRALQQTEAERVRHELSGGDASNGPSLPG